MKRKNLKVVFLNEQAEKETSVSDSEKANLIKSIMGHLTVSRKKGSPTFLKNASYRMSNEEINYFCLKVYKILEDSLILWGMIGKGQGSAGRNNVIRKRVYNFLNSLSDSETLNLNHVKSVLGTEGSDSRGFTSYDPHRKIIVIRNRIVAKNRKDNYNKVNFFRYLFRALHPELLDEKTKSETNFEKYFLFNNLLKLKSIDKNAVESIEKFIYYNAGEEDVDLDGRREPYELTPNLEIIIQKIKNSNFDNQIKSSYIKLIFSVVEYIFDHFLLEAHYPGAHYYLQDISDNIFSEYEEGIFDYYKELLKEKSSTQVNENREKLKNGCIPARRRISSGGKTGSYASARTGGKQAYAALKKVKPPSKTKNICCHKCPNDRSAPNGYVCTNPAHLYWGTKGDNTVDQHHGNGTASKNESEIRSDIRAYAYELLKERASGVISLSIKDLKSLIFEEVGAAYFGDSFLEFKKKTEQGEFAFDVLSDMGTKVKYVGEGSTRFVYQFKDNPDIVIKIINWPKGRDPEEKVWSGFKKSHMIDSNKWESDLLIQQRYSDVFPRTFEVAKDYTWILSEMVDPIKDYKELFNIMGIDDSIFPPNKKIFTMLFKELIADCIKIFQDPDSSVRKIVFSNKVIREVSTRLEALPTFSFGDTTRKDDTKKIEKQSEQTFSPFYRSYLETIKKIVTNKQNAKILGAMGSLKIPPREFSPKNLGISRISKKLVILDASLWEKYIKS